MSGRDNPKNRPLSMRQVADSIGYSYEHVRKVVNGEPAGSKEFNDALCTALGLDVEAMWKLSQYEKVKRRYSAKSSLGDAVFTDLSLKVLWAELSEASRAEAVRFIEALVARERIHQELARATARDG